MLWANYTGIPTLRPETCNRERGFSKIILTYYCNLLKIKLTGKENCMSKTITPWGRQCKAQLAIKGIFLTGLSDATGLSRTYLSAIINGRITAPRETINKVNHALDIQQEANACL